MSGFTTAARLLGCNICKTPAIGPGVIYQDPIEAGRRLLICGACWANMVSLFPGVSCDACASNCLDVTYALGQLHGYQSAMRRANKYGAEDPSPKRNKRVATLARRADAARAKQLAHHARHRAANNWHVPIKEGA